MNKWGKIFVCVSIIVIVWIGVVMYISKNQEKGYMKYLGHRVITESNSMSGLPADTQMIVGINMNRASFILSDLTEIPINVVINLPKKYKF